MKEKHLDKQDAENRQDQTVTEKDAGSILEPEVLEQLPPEAKRLVEMTSVLAGSFPVHPPFMKKINEEHISKILDISERDNQRHFEDAQSSKKYNLLYAILFSTLFVVTLVFLGGKNPELLKELLKDLAIFAGGGGVGYSIKAHRGKGDR